MAQSASPRRRFQWRRWNNILHRDIGYVCVALTVIYAVSGIAVNHIHDWNLNYRIELDWDTTLALVEECKWGELLQADQLTKEMQKLNVFVGFQEGTIDFRPSYRMQRTEEKWSNKRRQPPSYTDRILWLSSPGCMSELKQLSYTSNRDMLGSDHRPVSAQFELGLRRMYDGHLMVAKAATTAKDADGIVIQLTSFNVNPVLAEAHHLRQPLLVKIESNALLSPVLAGSLEGFERKCYWALNKTGAGLRVFPYIQDIEWLKTQHIHLTCSVVTGSDSSVWGHVVVSLKKRSFEAIITLGGRVVGHVSFHTF